VEQGIADDGAAGLGQQHLEFRRRLERIALEGLDGDVLGRIALLRR
jgi:hypothetical protein